MAGIITVEKGYETAIETALGFALQNIVVEDQGCARAAIGFLKDERAGRATFLPLDTVQGSRFTGRLTGTAEVAADLVRTDPKYQHIIDNLLGRIIVVEDLTEASAVARNLLATGTASSRWTARSSTRAARSPAAPPPAASACSAASRSWTSCAAS